MNRIEEINRELNKLPNGYISKKKINNKVCFYLQYRIGNKIISKYIRPEQLESLENDISRRKELEKEYKELTKDKDFLLSDNISNNALSLSGDVMEEDDVVASFKDGMMTYVDEKKAPFIIIRTHSLEEFLMSRAIDAHRTNYRLLKKVLRIKENNEMESVLKVYARIITDHFWFRPLHSKIHFKDLEFKTDMYSDVALKGIVRDIKSKPRFNPELTSIGSYEKCWKIVDDGWYMYKSGTLNEIFSEVFCSRLAMKLGIPSATYEMEGDYIKTKNFAENYDFDPMRSVGGDDDSYEHCFPLVYKLSPDLAKQYLTLMWFDALVYNPDRHNENYGFMRDRKTGKIISLAPNFDNNLALFARDVPMIPERSKDGLIKMFSKFISQNEEAYEIYSSLVFLKITKPMIGDIISDLNCPVSKDFLFDYLNEAWKILELLKR